MHVLWEQISQQRSQSFRGGHILNTLEKRGDEKGDEEMRDRVGDFNKLTALEVQIQKSCHSKYIVKHQGKSESPYNTELCRKEF